MQTKVVQHVPRINISIWHMTCDIIKNTHFWAYPWKQKFFSMSQGSTHPVTGTVKVTGTDKAQTQLVSSFCKKHLTFFILFHLTRRKSVVIFAILCCINYDENLKPMAGTMVLSIDCRDSLSSCQIWPLAVLSHGTIPSVIHAYQSGFRLPLTNHNIFN